MGYLMVRMSLITLIHNFNFQHVDDKFEFSSASFVLAEKNYIRMKIKRREIHSE